MKKVNVISFSLSRGGAAIAAKKFIDLLSGVRYVNIVSQDGADKLQFIKRILSWGLGLLQISRNKTKHSLNLFSYHPVISAFKNKKKDEIFHLHWFNNDTISIFDLDKIPLNSIITLHDEWLYCGSEHYYDPNHDKKLDFISGYHFFSSGSFGFGWQYVIWRIKVAKLKNRSDIIYTVPSSWMLKRAKSSLILKNSTVLLLPNPIDVNVFYPRVFRKELRSTLSFYKNEFVICFGAIGGKKNPLKGGHILDRALKIVAEKIRLEGKEIRLVIFGQSGEDKVLHGFRTSYAGHIKEQSALADLFCASDCVVVPSIVESFGQVAAESMACGTPVVAFRTSGLTDIVIDGVNGFLAEPFEPVSLADKVIQIASLSNEEKYNYSVRARKHIEDSFSYEVISKKYFDIISLSENNESR
uniref:Glycosyltransferase n=1 Tax=Aeromonas hydrophila TaxID=644 RepID=A0A346AC64_AERHY|nr:glycosyltransferase [Aeromonas hydrophila]